jgi:uncharacterized protein
MTGLEAFPIEQILRIIEKHGGLDPRVFGSRSRGDAGDNSDLDLLIKPGPSMSLFDLIGLQQELEELLGIKVEVISEGGIHPLLKDEILAEARPLIAA